MSECRWLDHGHLPEVIALHAEALRGVPAGRVARESDAFFAAHMAECGRIAGVFAHGRLVAYAVLGLPAEGAPNFGEDHGLSAAELRRVAHLDGVAVSPSWRGRGLQRQLIELRLTLARAQGRDIVLATAAPDNPASVLNLLQAGLRARGLRQRFGGWRYLMRLDLLAAPLRWQEAVRSLSCADIEGQRALLAQGWQGCALIAGRDEAPQPEGAGGPAMLFRRPDPVS